MRKFSDEELLELHQAGLTDRQISERFHVTQGAVNYRREKLGLTNNFERDTFTDAELLDLHRQGLTDREIGEALGFTQAAINYRRARLGLESNYIREKVFLTLYHRGLSLEEIASALKVPLAAVMHAAEKYVKYELAPEKGQTEAEV